MNNISERYQQDDLNAAAETILSGGIILYPTDTIWGIGCDATNPEAVEKIYNIKDRDRNKSMIVLVEHENKLDFYLEEVPEVAFQLIEVSDKPLTLVLPGARNLAPNVVSQDGSIAIRVCENEFCKALMRKCRKPLVSTSANFSGSSSPRNFSEIDPTLVEMADYVCRFKQEDRSLAQASTIISLGKGGEVKVIRK